MPPLLRFERGTLLSDEANPLLAFRTCRSDRKLRFATASTAVAGYVAAEKQ
jgi:hypothetical protein